jgi:hypothetical protein
VAAAQTQDSLFQRDLRFLARRGNGMMKFRQQHAAAMEMDSVPMPEHEHHDGCTPQFHD